jgi:glycosyltransferase involved in cell wall biosynthesis
MLRCAYSEPRCSRKIYISQTDLIYCLFDRTISMNPKVTVGISFKNPGRYFELAIKSVFAQTFTEWELILIDDGSTDKSLEFAENISDDRVRVYSDGYSKGLNIRLNQMVQLARAPYFFRMDADDIMHFIRIEKQYQILKEHDDSIAVVVGSAAYSIDNTSSVIGLRQSAPTQHHSFNARHSFIHPTVAAKTAWFKANPYSEDRKFHRCEDAELWCRTTATTKFINLQEPLLFYREANAFSFDKYSETALGLMHTIDRYYGQNIFQLLYLRSKELLKLWCFMLLTRINMTDLMISNRYNKIDPNFQHEADRLLITSISYSLGFNYSRPVSV